MSSFRQDLYDLVGVGEICEYHVGVQHYEL
jgi:hypothetical protein